MKRRVLDDSQDVFLVPVLITSYIKKDKNFQILAAALKTGPARVYAPTFFQGYLLASLRDEIWPEEAMLVVAPGGAEASRLADDLCAFAGRMPVRLLPAAGTAPGSRVIASSRLVGLRHAALWSLAAGRPGIVVADIAAMADGSLDPGRWPEAVHIGKENPGNFDEIIESLASLGYERVQQVEDRGEFAVRGGIIDVFPSTDQAPLRLEFWGDEFESLRRFSPFTQRSLLEEESATVFAAAEPEEPDAGGEKTAAGRRLSSGLLDREIIRTRVCRIDPAAGRDSFVSYWEDVLEASPVGKSAGHYLRPEELDERLHAAASLVLESLPADQPHSFSATGFHFASRRVSEAAVELERMVSGGFKVFVHFSSEGAARRAEHNLAGSTAFLAEGKSAPDKPGAYLVLVPPPTGFVNKDMKLAVVGERTLIRSSRSARSRTLGLAGRAIMSFRDLTPGDFVVHKDHGIGVFEAVETKTVAGITRDYLHLRFKGDDRLFVPQEQISMVSRYVGGQAGSPPLNKLGGRAWSQARARAKNAAREMAGELLQLYALRQSLPGDEFAADDQWQMELEAAFPFEETPDQAAAIEDVKDDMESPHPMDRLICGDVGYGKTEVAVRAAFKAAIQGRQVLMLVPTTILTLQHFNTFSSRFSKYPVNVEMISRFRSAAQTRRIAADFREGRIDVLIGTHRVLSADVVPKDLGLVIVDEEQRFGVHQKETLRQLRLRVDVLSLSATPIPRTLQMSLSGIRDISIMETPPLGRYPIRTYVGEYDDEVISQAIMKEAARGGQVFFLHNRVETIAEKAEELKALLPHVRFIVAHGQMPEKELETVMVSFLEKEADVLVCTSIIESGLDIPTANTLIVDRADMLGLSQLYQIRGRIGRSDVMAHAYLLYPPNATLTREAMARLSTLSDYTELGSGFKIAMRDLEIRGAGNLLGGEQSGHVAAVGFDMYCDLLRQAVAELNNQPVEEPRTARLDADIDAYIPSGYIPLETARIDVHHRIAAARDEQQLADMETELLDRFGPVPDVVKNLLDMQEIRLKAGVLGTSLVTYKKGRLELADMHVSSIQREILEEAGLKFVYYPLRRILVFRPGEEAGEDGGLSIIKRLLDAIMDSLLTPSGKM